MLLFPETLFFYPECNDIPLLNYFCSKGEYIGVSHAMFYISAHIGWYEKNHSSFHTFFSFLEKSENTLIFQNSVFKKVVRDPPFFFAFSDSIFFKLPVKKN